MADIEAVDIGDGPTIFNEKGSEIEEPQGLSPEVIGREVVNPGVDQEEIVLFSLQRFFSMVQGQQKKRLWHDRCSVHG